MIRPRTRTALVVLSAGAVLALTGCAAAHPGQPTATGSSAGSESTVSATASESVTPSASPTPEVTPTIVAPGAFNTPSTGGVRYAPTASGPLDGKVITLDPGHNGKWITSVNQKNYLMFGIGWRPCQSQGGTAADGKTLEPEVALVIAQKTMAAMRAQGATVVLTRPDNDGTGPCNNERAEIANRNASNLLISIHLDGAASTKATGFQVLYSEKMLGGAASSQASHVLANAVASQLKTHMTIPPSRAIPGDLPVAARSGDLGVLNGVGSGAAVLAELGFISSPSDFAFMNSAAGQDAIAAAFLAAAQQALADPTFAKATPHVTSSAMPPATATAPVPEATPAAPTLATPVAPAPTASPS